MVTVQHLVRKELERSPVVCDLLSEGLLNVSALAVKLYPDVCKEIGRRIKLSAVSMAVRRYSKTLRFKEHSAWAFPSNLGVSTQSNLFEAAFRRSPRTADVLRMLSIGLKRGKGDFVSVVEG